MKLHSKTNNFPIVGGIYRHYKSSGGLNHAYRIVGIAYSTEAKENLVIYEPLYPNELLITSNINYFARPVSMFLETVEVDGKTTERFELLSNPNDF